MYFFSRLIKSIILLCLLALPFTAPARADGDDVLFHLVSADGKTSLDVTDAVIEKVGTISFKANLPSTDNPISEVKGPRLRDLIAATGLKSSLVTIKALDGYEMDIPAEDFDRYDVIVATEVEGQRISRRTRGPGWVAYPSVEHPELMGDVYLARCVWQVKDIIIK